MSKATGILLSTALAPLLVLSAQAQEAPGAQDEIVVTAQKREQQINDVPVAMSAVSAEALAEAGIFDITTLIPYLPGVSGSSTGIGTNIWNIRGIGTNDWSVGSEPSVAVFLDDAYVGRNVLATSALFDLERVEVLRGPQGTLSGRNASAGAINIITRRPEEANSLQVGAGVGNEGQTEPELIGNLALSDILQVRFAYRGEGNEGIQFAEGLNQDYSQDADSFRATARWAPTTTTEALLSGHYSVSQSTRTRFHNADFAALLGSPGAGDPFADRTSADSPSFEEAEIRGADLRVTHDFSNGLTLTSITDWRSWDYVYSQDLDGVGVAVPVDLGALFGAPGSIVTFGSPVFFEPLISAETESQEFRLNGAIGERVEWFAGASYFHERVAENAAAAWPMNMDLDVLLGGGGVVAVMTTAAPAEFHTRGDYTSIGVYGDMRIELSDLFAVTGGVRWTDDEKDFCARNVDPTFGFLQFLGPDTLGADICGTQSSDDLTYRAIAEFTPSEDILLYASFATGYKGGGFNSAVLGSGPFGIDPPFAVAPFDPETSGSIELGAKLGLFDGALQLNAAIYTTDYENLQLLNNVISLRIENVGAVSSDGAELDLIWTPRSVEGLRASLSYAYNDSQISAPGLPVDGSPLSIAPQNTLSSMVEYTHPMGGLGELSWFAGYSWRDDFLFDVNGARYRQEAYGVLDASLTFRPPGGAFDLSLRANNLLDEEFIVSASDPLGLGFPITQRGDPLLYSLRLNVYFGQH